MGIFDALNTAVGGLQAQSFALQNISGNIANASTTGYKGIDTNFEDLIPDATTPNRQVAGGVTAYAQATITTQGTVSASTVATNMAINGDGFFSVQAATGTTDNVPNFSGVTDYTRRGDFQVNANGNLVNGAGYFLMGVPVDPKTGNPLGNVPQVLQFQNNFIPAQATSALTYAANLPTTPTTQASSTAAAGSITAAGGINAADFASNPLVIGSPAPLINASITGAPTNATATTPYTSTAAAAGGQLLIAGPANATATTPISALTGGPAAGDNFVVNGVTVTFAATGAASSVDPTHVTIGLDQTLGALATEIDSITGNTTNASNATGGKFNLNTGLAANLTLAAGTSTGTLAALGLTAAATARGGGIVSTPALTAGTLLSGTAAAPGALSPGFAVGDSITVDGTTISFVASGATGNQINVTDNVGTLLSKISVITGATATVSPTGQIVLNTGTSQNLNIVGNTTSATTALGGLGFATVPITQARAAGTNVGTGVVTANDLQTFTNESISGGAVTAYNAAGTPVNLQLRWAKTDSASLGPGHQDSWNLFYQTSTSATGTQAAWVNSGTTFAFNASGALSSPTGSSINVPNVTVDGQTLGPLSLNIGAGSLTQFASTSGAATVNGITQNGYAAGQLQSVAINNNGIVVGTFSNGQNLDLASVTLSHFNGTNYLKALNGGAYEVTDQSGPAIAGASGSISGSSLEGSNTDIADEFTKLIVTQQAYSANTKVITTANSMVQDLLNVLR
jgi:flagellar hook protein FlgE